MSAIMAIQTVNELNNITVCSIRPLGLVPPYRQPKVVY